VQKAVNRISKARFN